jgi:hypothetical protein
VERHGDQRFYKLLDEIADLHSRKNHDYARTQEPLSNFNRATALGVEPWRGVLVRMSDKWSRLEQLASGKSPKNESMRDTLIDLAVYSLIDVLLLEDAESAKAASPVLDAGPKVSFGPVEPLYRPGPDDEVTVNTTIPPSAPIVEAVGQFGYVIRKE